MTVPPALHRPPGLASARTQLLFGQRAMRGQSPMATATTDIDVKAQRGAKRTCQNPECGSRYDLNRDPITCPVCVSVYAIPVSPPVTAAEERAKRPEAKQRAVPVAAAKPEETPEAECDELIVEGED